MKNIITIALFIVFALFIPASCTHKPPLPPVEEKVPDISGDIWYMIIDPIKYSTSNGSGTYYFQQFVLDFKKVSETKLTYTIGGATSQEDMTGTAIYDKTTKQFTCDTVFANEDEIGYFTCKYNPEKNELKGTIYIDVYIHTSVITGFYVHLEGHLWITH